MKTIIALLALMAVAFAATETFEVPVDAFARRYTTNEVSVVAYDPSGRYKEEWFKVNAVDEVRYRNQENTGWLFVTNKYWTGKTFMVPYEVEELTVTNEPGMGIRWKRSAGNIETLTQPPPLPR